MYETLVFAESKPSVITTNISQAVDQVSSLVVNPVPIELGNLRINENATITNDIDHTVTLNGFENFSKILGIPNPFARKIPVDLLFSNIRRLQEEKRDQVVVLLERENGEIANIAKAPYLEASYLDVLSVFADREDINYIETSEELLTIALINPDSYFNGPDGKPFHIGTFVYSSILKAVQTHMVNGLFRRVCSNSYITPFLGKFTSNYLQKDIQQRLQSFSELAYRVDYELLEVIKNRFDGLQSRSLFDYEFVKLWQKLIKVLSYSEADNLLKTTEEERKEIQKRVIRRTISNKRAKFLGQSVEEPILLTLNMFETINEVTSRAQKFTGFNRLFLEKTGGEWLGNILLN